jgi:diguanylate cyclase (GGDEF)-like protein/PAS domain S-box-containing protein
MSNTDSPSTNPSPEPRGPEQREAARNWLDDADRRAGEVLEADARSAKEYLTAAAAMAAKYLAASEPEVEAVDVERRATAAAAAVEVLTTAEQVAADLLDTAKSVAAAKLASAHRFEAMFRDHGATMLLIDPATGLIVDANPSAATFYGYTVDDLTSMPITRINMMPASEVAARLSEARSRTHSHFTFPHRLANGEIRRVDVASSPIHDGRPLLFSIITDAEERVRAEEEVAHQAQRLELVLSASRLGLWDWNMVTGEAVFDERWAEIIGYKLDELQPVSIDTWVRFSRPEDLVHSNELIKQHTDGATPYYDAEVRMKHRDGHWVWVRDRGKVVEWTSDGRPLRMTGTHEDITEARAAATRLAVAEEESRLAFDRARVPTCLVSNEGVLLRANSAMCELLARSEAELLTMSFLDVTHPDDRFVGADLLRDLLAGRTQSLRLTKRYVTGRRRVIWGDVTVSAVTNADGTVRHRIAQILDVSAEHALRGWLLEAQRIAHLGNWRLVLATGAVTWSSELFAMFGLDPEGGAPDYVGQQPLFTPESWERLDAAVSETRTTGSPYELELELVRCDCTRGWLQARGEAIRDADGTVVELQGVSLDITDRKIAEKSLTASEALLRAVLDTSPDTTLRLDREGRVGYVNERGVQISGISRERWIGRTIAELGYPDELFESWQAHRQAVFTTGKSVTFEFEIDNTEGHRWYETTVAPEVNADGATTHVIETSRDITERKAVDAELRASRALLQQAQHIAHVGAWTLDLATNHVTWSEELYLMQGMDPQVPPPDYTEHSRLFTGASWQQLSAALATTTQTAAPYELELEMIRPDASHGWMLARGEAVRDDGGAIIGLMGVALDITERKIAADKLQLMATHDPLTGLANRAALLDAASRALSAARRSARSTAVLMVDLDRFKNVNDTQGHAAGDELLVAAARCIEDVVRTGDLVARLGGDEFVVVLHGLEDPGTAVRVAGRLVAAFRDPFIIGGVEVLATVSVGVAIAEASSTGADLLHEADVAMYAAKERGRDQVAVFHDLAGPDAGLA